jgi:hypothetical protein
VPEYLDLNQPYSLWILDLAFSFIFILLIDCCKLNLILSDDFVIAIMTFLLEENWILHRQNSLCSLNFYNLHWPSFLIPEIFSLLQFLMLNLVSFFQFFVYLYYFYANDFFIDYKQSTELQQFRILILLRFQLQHHLHCHYFFSNINLNYQLS